MKKSIRLAVAGVLASACIAGSASAIASGSVSSYGSIKNLTDAAVPAGTVLKGAITMFRGGLLDPTGGDLKMTTVTAITAGGAHHGYTSKLTTSCAAVIGGDIVALPTVTRSDVSTIAAGNIHTACPVGRTASSASGSIDDI